MSPGCLPIPNVLPGVKLFIVFIGMDVGGGGRIKGPGVRVQGEGPLAKKKVLSSLWVHAMCRNVVVACVMIPFINVIVVIVSIVRVVMVMHVM